MTVYIVDIEAVETRYTGQWKTHVPNLLQNQGIKVEIISGPVDIPSSTTPGAFLNFGGTNVYKASQVEQISRLFCSGTVHSGDHFLFTDAWHPGIINLKYMSELLQIPVKIHALWHAGSYDPEDFLGRLIGDKPWVRNAEKSMYWAIDHNYFATDFHIKMFFDNLLHNGAPTSNPWYQDDWLERFDGDKIVRSGWPMEYMEELLTSYKNMPKQNLILFPHRIAPEKQVDIFRDLKIRLPQYEFVVCQDQKLTKHEYHNLLSRAKLVFSANLQETLGISCYEGALLDAIPMVPDRLSYSEMYFETFKYPSEWTENFFSYETYREELCNKIIDHMESYETKLPTLKKQTEILSKDFFSADEILKRLI